ncbi:MAG: putative porin [Rikenellaceae bacterium]
MHKQIFRNIFALLGTILLVLCSGDVYAQATLPGQDEKPEDANPFFDNQGPGREEVPDSLKKKERKPLESYLIPDSLQIRGAFAWNVNLFENKINFIDIDTALYMNQVDYEFLKEDVGDAFLGNLGGATYPLNYMRRARAVDDFSMVNAYKSYFVTPSTADYFNTKRMYTRFNYLSAGQTKYREENFAITHAQNISPSTGFNIDYKSRGTRGIYTWQVARAKSLSASFSHTGKRYSLHAGYIYNAINVKENGGVQNDSDITDTIFEITYNVPVNLEDARNVIKNNTYYVVQSYAIPFSRMTVYDNSIADKTSIYFGHSFEYTRMRRNYTDTKENTVDGFYENWYVNASETSDSTFQSVISNKLFMQFQPWSRNGVVGLINAGIGVDYNHYYQFNIDQYQTGNTDGVNEMSYYVYGSIEGKIKKFLSWDANLQYHPAGYKSQDYSFGANLRLNPRILRHTFSLKAGFTQELSTPDYWSENYFSNHYKWSNSFEKENETRIDASLSCPSLGLEIGANMSAVINKIYYNSSSIAVQSDETVVVSGIYLHKDFQIKGFHFNHRVLLQWSTAQEVVPVPLASAFLSYYYEFNVVKNVLRVQAGFDCRYNTAYYAHGYNPATAQFYNQTSTLVGDYPTVDAFVNAKWKRMRILVKYSHLNESLFDSRNYFSVLHYPQNERILKFGISWSFYD